MPRRYSFKGQQAAISTTQKTGLAIISATTIRPKLYSFILGTLGAAANGVLEWVLRRFTATGTSTAVTPNGNDPADPPALASGGSNHSAEPTYTAGSEMFDMGINQQATYTWNAWTEGAQIVSPATANNGVGMSALSSVSPAYTGAAALTFMYEE